MLFGTFPLFTNHQRSQRKTPPVQPAQPTPQPQLQPLLRIPAASAVHAPTASKPSRAETKRKAQDSSTIVFGLADVDSALFKQPADARRTSVGSNASAASTASRASRASSRASGYREPTVVIVPQVSRRKALVSTQYVL